MSLHDFNPFYSVSNIDVLSRNISIDQTSYRAKKKIPLIFLFHSIEKELSLREGAYLLFCMCLLSLTSKPLLFGCVLNIIVFAFNSKSKLTESS